MKEWRDNFLAFIAVITELFLGTLLFIYNNIFGALFGVGRWLVSTTHKVR